METNQSIVIADMMESQRRLTEKQKKDQAQHFLSYKEQRAFKHI